MSQPVVSDVSHEPFPDDGRLYRIFWGGQLILPKADHSTPRVRIWLKEIDEQGWDIPRRDIVQVTESVGSIPCLVIGSCWRNGRKARPKHAVLPKTESIEIVAPATWDTVRAGDNIPANHGSGSPTHSWINPSDLRLLFDTSTGTRVRGLDAKLVSARTTSGQEILIPSYEIFRSFFAGTTDLSLALVRNTWNAAESRFIAGGQETSSPAGAQWRIDLAPGVPHSAVPYLSWLHFDKTARNAANQIYPAIVNQRYSKWISAIPPISGKTFRIQAQAITLKSRNALLVTQIVSFEFPHKLTELSYSFPRRDIPVLLPPNSGAPPQEAAPEVKSTSISKPIDRRPTQRFVLLPSNGAKFIGLPKATRSARTDRYVQVPVTTPSSQPPIRRQVSVGEPGRHPAPLAAQFTPDEQRVIEDRFQAIRDLVEDLIADGEIDCVTDHAIVRPVPTGAPTYCELPYSEPTRPWPWSMVREPAIRPRLALVLELGVGERLVYWIETEHVGSEHRRSLAVEMVTGGSLDEGTLEALLDVCAQRKGVWPTSIPFGDGTLFSVLAPHTRAGGRLARSVVLNALERLWVKRNKMAENAVTSAAEASAQLDIPK